MGLLLQGSSSNIADIQFEGGSGNKAVTIPKEGGKLAVTDSPTFTGTPTAPTPTAGDNSTKVATTAYVDGKMVRGTAVTASGTSIDFTGIPSWVKRITVMLDVVSTNGSSPVQVQLGDSGGVETSGYVAVAGAYPSSPSSSAFTTGFGLIDLPSGAASYFYNGFLDFVNISNTSWVCSATIQINPTGASTVAGSKTLSGTLDRVRITTVNGTDAFDAGSINIMYEG